jgi:hypothetical protein
MFDTVISEIVKKSLDKKDIDALVTKLKPAIMKDLETRILDELKHVDISYLVDDIFNDTKVINIIRKNLVDKLTK